MCLCACSDSAPCGQTLYSDNAMCTFSFSFLQLSHIRVLRTESFSFFHGTYSKQFAMIVVADYH